MHDLEITIWLVYKRNTYSFYRKKLNHMFIIQEDCPLPYTFTTGWKQGLRATLQLNCINNGRSTPYNYDKKT